MRWGPHRRLSLKAMMRRSVRLASRPGLWWGLQERSSIGWPAWYRPTHRLAVAGETWKRSAAGAWASLLPPPDEQDDGAPQGSAVR